MSMAKKAHVLAVPFPGQGHVKPLMKLCRGIAKRGIKVTFVNLERIHDKLVAARRDEDEDEDEVDNMVLASVPDGLKAGDDPNDTFRLLETLRSSLVGSLTRVIESCDPDEKVTCMIVDLALDWVLEAAVETMGVEEAFPFSPASAAAMTLTFQIPKLLQDGILDSNGSVTKGDQFVLSDDIPAWGKGDTPWSFSSNLEIQKMFFGCAIGIEKTTKPSKMVLINTCFEIESSACELYPSFLPLGPLLESNTPKSSSISYNFQPEDASCLDWLDSKPPGSVVYVSFGSLAVFSQHQFEELALGLENSGRNFLWVVRLGLANGSQAVHPSGFLDRVSEVGKIVEWAPQEKVLSHPSVACFLTHCGWNSTMEGLSMGVPFLCWPSFSDQFHNQSYICYKWETGLKIDPDENGIRTRDEIKKKVDMVFSCDNLKANALTFKELTRKSLEEGGSSYKNFERFIDYLRK